jgi:muramoyltetrapeptide carboxypeptidase
MYKIPPALKPGDTIGIISPASRPLNMERFERGVAYLKAKGFQVKIAPHALDQHGYLAGTDPDRAMDLNEMFRDPAVKIIICSRGGYGVPRLLHLIDYDTIRANPKIFVGYSDISALQQAILAQCRLVTYSGPMVAVEMGAGIDPMTEKHFFDLLHHPEQSHLLNYPGEMSFKVLKSGKAEGFLMGGCLSVLCGVVGSPYLPDFEDSILVIEDIDEEPYSIDRNLSHLKAAGIFQQVKGIVVGQFLDSELKDPTKPSLTIDQVLNEILGDLPVPIVYDYAYGHGPRKFTIPFGARARLDTDTETFELIHPELS